MVGLLLSEQGIGHEEFDELYAVGIPAFRNIGPAELRGRGQKRPVSLRKRREVQEMPRSLGDQRLTSRWFCRPGSLSRMSRVKDHPRVPADQRRSSKHRPGFPGMAARSSSIDGTDELIAELDRLSAQLEVAARAPRWKALYRYLAEGMSPQARLGEPGPSEFEDLTERLLVRMSIWWSADAYRLMPVMTPWCVRDRSCRYDQGPEEWGAPREDGYLRDDNSIIKKLPLPVTVTAPPNHPYHGRCWWGFTACHIWRELPGGAIAGEDPWLYSFMPNLVWLPSWLAPLTDRHESHVQELLQRVSYQRYRRAPVEPAVAAYAEHGWSRLGEPRAGTDA